MSAKEKTVNSSGKKAGFSPKSIISLIISFILSYLIVILFIGICLKMSIFNINNLEKNIKNDNYYQGAFTEIETVFKKRLETSGLPATVYEGILTPDSVKKEVDAYADSVLNGESYSFDSKAMHDKLYANIQSHFERTRGEFSDQLKESAERFVNTLILAFTDGVKVPFLGSISALIKRFDSIFPLLFVVSALGVFVLIILLLLIHRYKHRGTRYIAYSFITASLLIGIPTLYLRISDAFSKLSLLSIEHQKAFLSGYLNSLTRRMTSSSIIAVTIALLAILATLWMKDTVMKSTARNRLRSERSADRTDGEKKN